MIRTTTARTILQCGAWQLRQVITARKNAVIDFLFGVFGIQEQASVLMDSGSDEHVCKPSFAPLIKVNESDVGGPLVDRIDGAKKGFSFAFGAFRDERPFASLSRFGGVPFRRTKSMSAPSETPESPPRVEASEKLTADALRVREREPDARASRKVPSRRESRRTNARDVRW